VNLKLRRPDDWHLHLRDGAMLRGVLPHSADFARAIIMPNLVPPVVTKADAEAYRARILDALPASQNFTPLMTLYLTETTEASDVVAAFEAGVIKAVKLYPAGATTNSHGGVRDFTKVQGVLEAMAEAGITLCVHGEVTDPEIDIFDREAVFIDRVLEPLRERTPNLRIVMEHVTTRDAVDYVMASDDNLAATITTHHLIINRNMLFQGGIRPHYYCLPIAKREHHRQSLLRAATSGNHKFFLGTDSAPHVDPLKECACGCAGIFSSSVTIGCLAHVFEDENALDTLEAFTSLNGPAFYRLVPNEQMITLEKQEEPIAHPDKIMTGAGPVTVFDPGFKIHWKVRTEDIQAAA
jgi:dihydroorotase